MECIYQVFAHAMWPSIIDTFSIFLPIVVDTFVMSLRKKRLILVKIHEVLTHFTFTSCNPEGYTKMARIFTNSQCKPLLFMTNSE